MTIPDSSTALPVKLTGNPFVVESPEKLLPEQIVALFVKDYTRLETVKQRRHTFIWGSRGSGKSMMFRYLEPRCQAIAEGSYEAVFDKQGPFLAVYCPCKEGHFNRSELDIIEDATAAVLSEHLLNVTIAYSTTGCLLQQFKPEFLNNAECRKLVSTAAKLFDYPASIAASNKEAKTAANPSSEPLLWFKHLLFAEIRKISNFLRERCLRGTRASYRA